MNKNLSIIGVALVGVALFAGWQAKKLTSAKDRLANTATQTQSNTTQAPINRQLLKLGTQAPDFEVTTIDGKLLTLADFKGKILVLTSGAAWCPTCIIENKNFNPVFQEFKDKGVEFITVDIDPLDSPEAINEFQTRYAPWHNVHVSKAEEMLNDYGFWRFEITYVIDKQSTVQFVDQTITETNTLRSQLAKLI